jgi:hypothetical protein
MGRRNGSDLQEHKGIGLHGPALCRTRGLTTVHDESVTCRRCLALMTIGFLAALHLLDAPRRSISARES